MEGQNLRHGAAFGMAGVLAWSAVHLARPPQPDLRRQRRPVRPPLSLDEGIAVVRRQAAAGPFTISEVARSVGRKPDAARRWIEAAIEQGFVVPAGTRQVTRHAVAVYRAVA